MSDKKTKLTQMTNKVVGARRQLSDPKMGNSHVQEAKRLLDEAVSMIPNLVVTEMERLRLMKDLQSASVYWLPKGDKTPEEEAILCSLSERLNALIEESNQVFKISR